ncbi:MAG: nuclease-related domain-containing protein [Succinivibrionaceae bacterium]
MKYYIPLVFFFIALIVVSAIFYKYFFNRKSKKNNYKRRYIDKSAQREVFKSKIDGLFKHCDEIGLLSFLDFLKEYGGSYIKRKNGKVIKCDFLNEEKGLLKSLFYKRVVSSSKIDIQTKEEFRKFLLSKGVNNVNERPNYEERDGRLSIDKSLSEDDKARKISGNLGEQLVRDELEKLTDESFRIINGLQIKTHFNEVLEIDHLVVSSYNVFLIETKAYGINSEGVFEKCNIVVSKDTDWKKIKDNKGSITYSIVNPLKQIEKQRTIINKILKEFKVTNNIIIILVIPNSNVIISGDIDNLSCKILKLDELIPFIKSREKGKIISSFNIINKVNSLRIN